MKHARRDAALTLSALAHLEAERRLAQAPRVLVESGWVREAQAEAVVDALLVSVSAGNQGAYIHARHRGEWAARIVDELPDCAPPSVMRRAGALAELDPQVLERIPEVRECAPIVEAFQRIVMGDDAIGQTAKTGGLILAVADEFDSLVCDADDGEYSPGQALRAMASRATDATKPIVRALVKSVTRSPLAFEETAHVIL